LPPSSVMEDSLFYPEDGDGMFLRYIGNDLPRCMTSHSHKTVGFIVPAVRTHYFYVEPLHGNKFCETLLSFCYREYAILGVYMPDMHPSDMQQEFGSYCVANTLH
jgi:hypothetical protein